MPPRTIPFDFASQGYDLLKEIGSGQFGRVYLVTRFKDGEELIAKIVDLSNLERADKERAAQEVNVMQQLSHPHIVKCWDAFLYRNTYLVIIMEYCQGGDMAALLNNMRATNTRFSEREILEVLHQLASAMAFIHSHRILHRDLKPSNILITHNGGLKIADFGVSKRVDNTAAAAQTSVGTPQYTPPEMVMTQVYTSQCDMWALGCVVHEMMALQPAFQGESVLALAWKICFDAPATLPDFYSQGLRDLITALLHKDSSQRPSALDIMESECMQALRAAPDRFNLQLTPQPPISQSMSMSSSPKVAPDKAPLSPPPPAAIELAEAIEEVEQSATPSVTPLSLSVRELPRPERIRHFSMCRQSLFEEASFCQILLRRLTLAAEASDKPLVVLFATSHPEWSSLRLMECKKLRSLGRPEQVRELEAMRLCSINSTLLEQVREALTQEALIILKNKPWGNEGVVDYSPSNIQSDTDARINSLLDQDLAMPWLEKVAEEHEFGISQIEMEFLLFCILRDEVNTEHHSVTLRDLCALARLGLLPTLQARSTSKAQVDTACYLSGHAGDLASMAEFAEARKATYHNFEIVAEILIQGFDDKGDPITPGSFENALRHFGKGSNEDEIIVPPSEWQNVVRAHFQLTGDQSKLLYQVAAKTWAHQIQWKRTIQNLTRLLRSSHDRDQRSELGPVDQISNARRSASPLEENAEAKKLLRSSVCAYDAECLHRPEGLGRKGPSPSSASITTAPRSLTPDKKSLQETTSSLQDVSVPLPASSPDLAAREISPNSIQSPKGGGWVSVHVNAKRGALEHSPSFYTPYTPRTPTSTQSAADDFTPQSDSMSDHRRHLMHDVAAGCRTPGTFASEGHRKRAPPFLRRSENSMMEDICHFPRTSSSRRRRTPQHPYDGQIDEACSGMDRLYERQRRQTPRPHAPLGSCKMRPLTSSELEVPPYHLRNTTHHRLLLVLPNPQYLPDRSGLTRLTIIGVYSLEPIIDMLLQILDRRQIDVADLIQLLDTCTSNFGHLKSQCLLTTAEGSDSHSTASELHRLASRIQTVLGGLCADAMESHRSPARSNGGIAYFTFINGCNACVGELCGHSWQLLTVLRNTRYAGCVVDDQVLEHEENRFHAVHLLLPGDRIERSRPHLNRLRSDVIKRTEMDGECIYIATRATRAVIDWCKAALRYGQFEEDFNGPLSNEGAQFRLEGGSISQTTLSDDEQGHPMQPLFTSRKSYSIQSARRFESRHGPEMSGRYAASSAETRGFYPGTYTGEKSGRFSSEAAFSRFTHSDMLEGSPRSDGPGNAQSRLRGLTRASLLTADASPAGCTSQVLTVDSVSRRAPLFTRGAENSSRIEWDRMRPQQWHTQPVLNRQRFSSATDHHRHLFGPLGSSKPSHHRGNETPSSRSSRMSGSEDDYRYAYCTYSRG